MQTCTKNYVKKTHWFLTLRKKMKPKVYNPTMLLWVFIHINKNCCIFWRRGYYSVLIKCFAIKKTLEVIQCCYRTELLKFRGLQEISDLRFWHIFCSRHWVTQGLVVRPPLYDEHFGYYELNSKLYLYKGFVVQNVWPFIRSTVLLLSWAKCCYS